MLMTVPDDTQKLALAIAKMNRRLRQERQSDLTPTQLSVLGTLVQIGPTSPPRWPPVNVSAHRRPPARSTVSSSWAT